MSKSHRFLYSNTCTHTRCTQLNARKAHVMARDPTAASCHLSQGQWKLESETRLRRPKILRPPPLPATPRGKQNKSSTAASPTSTTSLHLHFAPHMASLDPSLHASLMSHHPLYKPLSPVPLIPQQEPPLLTSWCPSQFSEHTAHTIVVS
jgi:hypothetical protein